MVNMICDCANDVYNTEKVRQLIEEYKDECTDMVANSQLRWSSKKYNSVLEGVAYYKTSYYRALDSLYNFYDKRPSFLYQHMKSYMGLKGNAINVTIEIQGEGKIQINSILPKFKNKKWVGTYFSRIPIAIKAIPEPGYNFKEWNGFLQSTHQEEEIILLDSSTIIAIFE